MNKREWLFCSASITLGAWGGLHGSDAALVVYVVKHIAYAVIASGFFVWMTDFASRDTKGAFLFLACLSPWVVLLAGIINYT